MNKELCDAWRLADGRLAMIRGATRADLPAVEAFIEGLSLQSRYRRFFYPARELTPPMRRQFTRANPIVEMSLLAVVLDAGGHETLAGTAQYAVTQWPGHCEFGIVVADAWQRKGIARRLLSRLGGVARAAGVLSMEGDTLADNEPMRRLLLQAGFELRPHPDGPLLRRAAKQLQAAGEEEDCPVLAQVAALARRLRPAMESRLN